ncbi:DEAD/DEAH box helicase [Evansella halocellulosilytica]|uniref:DEAD/DEAH box helicase n=1 Tax=Evansella halocellulosilytica TaxID=2011013 RepID=UPI000BB6DE65|nr:DEAD/DEAH box helicase [Evansella halocellulosilytica]
MNRNGSITLDASFFFTDKQKGLLLTVALHHEINLPFTDITLIKQWLFQDDDTSCYGLAYHIETYHIDKEIKQGVFIPLTHLSTCLTVFQNVKKPFQLSHTFSTLLSVLIHKKAEVKNKQFVPTATGNWEWTSDVNEQIHETISIVQQCEQSLEKRALIDKNELNRTVRHFLHDWLQHSIIETTFFETNIVPFINRVQKKSTNEHVRSWLFALQHPTKQYSISKELYPHCLMAWTGGTTENHFQMMLLVTEPSNESEEWRVSLVLKEWQSGHVCSVEKILKGEHPFTKNPVRFIHQQIEHLQKSSFVSEFTISQPEIVMNHEEINQFLLHECQKLELSGIFVLVPQSLQEPPLVPKLHGDIAEQSAIEEQTYIWRGSSITWTYLINGTAVDEVTFRQWVEDKRHMIYVQNHWVIWDLKHAEKLLQHQQTYKTNHSEALFDAYRQYIEQKEGITSTGVNDHDESVIEWTFHIPSSSEITLNELKNFNRHWKELLRPYQQEGLLWLLNMRKRKLGACLADDMGLGKTIQTIAYIDCVKSLGVKEQTPALIVSPTSLVTNWANELEQFAPWLNVYVHEGKPTARHHSFKNNKNSADIVITSYPIAVIDKKYFQHEQWNSFILDEAQKLKNIETKQRHVISEITAYHTIALTGTPVENDPKEIWSIMDILNKGYLKTDSWFYDRFLHKLHHDRNAENQFDNLRKLISPFILRRTKQGYQSELSLPKKTKYQYNVSLSNEQKLLYEATVENLLDDYHELTHMEKRVKLFQTMTKLKQICNHPAHFLKEHSFSSLDHRSGKWDECMKLLCSLLAENKKGLIFTHYRHMGMLLEEGLRKRFHVNTPFFHGSLSTQERQNLVKDFQSNDHIPFMIISLRAGGVGLNLTSATEVIHYDRWWNPAVENQATDRVYRIGQKRPVGVHTFTTEGTLEEKISVMLSEKEWMTEELLQQNSLPLWKLSHDELESLLTLRS